MKITVGEWFRMARVGSDAFKRLMEAGLKYDRIRGFQATPETDLTTSISILREALGEDVEVSLKCFLCGRGVECGECVYRGVCDPTRVSQACICGRCRAEEDTMALYAIRFSERSRS